MNNKISFITELLNSKKIDASQKERLFLLTASEINKKDGRDEKIFAEIEAIKRQLVGVVGTKNTTKSDVATYAKRENAPKEITNFLKNFRENTNIKFASHIWDSVEKFPTIEDFINGIESDKKTFGFEKLYEFNIDLYNLIKYFLYIPTTKVENGIPKFGWPNLSEMKIGWQYPNNLLKEWSKANYDNQYDNPNFKFPMQYPIPANLTKSRINGKIISTFEDVVNAFKNEIQFRDDYLYDEITKKKELILPDFNLNSAEGLKGVQFYTYTRGIIIAIGRIFEMFKKNELNKEIFIESKFDKNYFVLSITQIASFPIKKINVNNLKDFIGGDLYYIIDNIFSLCDYSIISKFNDSNNNEIIGEIKILHDKTEGLIEKLRIKSLITEPQLFRLDSKVEGFTHKFKFYL